MNLQKITPAKMGDIIDVRKPLGLFYCIQDGQYTGCDNRTGDAWTEDFKSLSACKRWLKS